MTAEQKNTLNREFWQSVRTGQPLTGQYKPDEIAYLNQLTGQLRQAAVTRHIEQQQAIK